LTHVSEPQPSARVWPFSALSVLPHAVVVAIDRHARPRARVRESRRLQAVLLDARPAVIADSFRECRLEPGELLVRQRTRRVGARDRLQRALEPVVPQRLSRSTRVATEQSASSGGPSLPPVTVNVKFCVCR
jgi:hypothetical protein